MTYLGEAKSLPHLFQLSCQTWGLKVAMRIPHGKTRRDISFTQLYKDVHEMAGAVRSYGLVRGDALCLFSENCYEWALLDWACQTLGIILVPVYPTLPADQAKYIADDCGAKLFVSGSQPHHERIDGVIHIQKILLKGEPDALLERSKTTDWPQADWEAEIAKATLADVATIIYTSGTTGNPKGAVLTHEAFVSLVTNVRSQLPIDEHDTFLSWLPMAHVYERFAGLVLPTSVGATVVYAGSLATLANDLQEAQPTIMLAVPRFLESMRERILDSTKKMPPIRRRLFELALAQGTTKVRGGFAPLSGLLDKLVGEKIRARTGGKLKFFVSGGAAMPLHVYEFFGAFGLKVLQGYGLTETCAATSFNPPTDNHPDTVGIPLDGLQVRIAADGEILIKGPSVMRGYHNLPDATREAIDPEGWFHTGDVGKFVGKHLKITDRKKDILVLENGKNVAPQPIESKLRESRYIAEVVLLGDGQSYVGALVVPDLDQVGAYVQEQGMKVDDPSHLLDHEPVRALIKGEIDKVNKVLADYEKIKRYELISARFSVETGELTPSLKVKRKVVMERQSEAIKRLFKQG